MMESKHLTFVALARRCKQRIEESTAADPDLPASLRVGHLLWMCSRIELASDRTSLVRLNRWLGFLQGAMMANGIIDLSTAKNIFAEASIANGESEEVWLEHLDPQSALHPYVDVQA
jgi:hypothetical protein